MDTFFSPIGVWISKVGSILVFYAKKTVVSAHIIVAHGGPTSLSAFSPSLLSVGSPKEVVRGGLPDRRQSVAVAEGISRSAQGAPSLRQQMSLQQGAGGQTDGSSLLNIMSSSAMTTGSNSSLRNFTVKKVLLHNWKNVRKHSLARKVSPPA